MSYDHFGNQRMTKYSVYQITNINEDEDHPGYVGKASDDPISHLKRKISDAKLKFPSFAVHIKNNIAYPESKFNRAIWKWFTKEQKEDELFGFRIKILENFSTEDDMIYAEGKWQQEFDSIKNGWNQRLESTLRVESRPIEFRSIEVRGGEIRYVKESELATLVGITENIFAKKREKYPNDDQLGKALEEALETSEHFNKKYALEGHEDQPFSNYRDLQEGGSHESLNENRIPETALQKRISEVREKNKTKIIIEKISEFKFQKTEIFPNEILRPYRTNWNKSYSIDEKIPDGRHVCEEGILADLHRKLKSYPRICYHGGRIPGMTSVQNRLRAGESPAEAFQIVPPKSWAKVYKRVESGELSFFPPLEPNKPLDRNPNRGPIIAEGEYRIAFRGKGSIRNYIKEMTGSGIDGKTLNKRLKKFPLHEILKDRGVRPDCY